MKTVLEFALEYASYGWRVFPVHGIRDARCTCDGARNCKPGKHPRTLHGHLDATTDRAAIERWFTSMPDSNIGIATGELSGLVVVDVDAKNEGDAQMEALEKEHGELPVTVIAQTGGGGFHFFYRHPGRRVQSTVGKLAPGIDIRADGGFVVATPSRHESGRQYGWADGFAPGTVQLGSMPDWLLALVDGPPRPRTTGRDRRRSAGAWAELIQRPISEGGRNGTLTAVAGLLLGLKALPPPLAAALLYCLNEARCEPPLPASEVEGIVNSIARREAGQRRVTMTIRRGMARRLDGGQRGR
jgi:putative DNA primase/helicase